MHIEKLSVKDREVTVRLSADEIVKLCNSLHYAPENSRMIYIISFIAICFWCGISVNMAELITGDLLK